MMHILYLFVGKLIKLLGNKLEMPIPALHHLLGAVAAIPTMQSFRVGEVPTLGAPQNYEVEVGLGSN